MKKVTIVIPNYNGLKFMEPCMAALDKQLHEQYSLFVFHLVVGYVLHSPHEVMFCEADV